MTDLSRMATSWIEERHRDARADLDVSMVAPRWSRSIARLGREVADLETELRKRGVIR